MGHVIYIIRFSVKQFLKIIDEYRIHNEDRPLDISIWAVFAIEIPIKLQNIKSIYVAQFRI
ncbi:hypothetical protein PMEGAPR185_51780 [Priestia megaterium]